MPALLSQTLMHLWRFVASKGHLVAVSSDAAHGSIAQLRERQTEDLKVPGLIPGLGKFFNAFLHPKVLHTRSKVQIPR